MLSKVVTLHGGYHWQRSAVELVWLDGELGGDPADRAARAADVAADAVAVLSA